MTNGLIIQFFKEKIGLIYLGDLINDKTGKEHTRRELRQLLNIQHLHRTGRQLSPQQVTNYANILETVRDVIPDEIRDALENSTPHTPAQGDIVYLRSPTECIAASYERPYGNSHILKHILIDTVGKPHRYTTSLTSRGYHIIPAAKWMSHKSEKSAVLHISGHLWVKSCVPKGSREV